MFTAFASTYNPRQKVLRQRLFYNLKSTFWLLIYILVNEFFSEIDVRFMFLLKIGNSRKNRSYFINRTSISEKIYWPRYKQCLLSCKIASVWILLSGIVAQIAHIRDNQKMNKNNNIESLTTIGVIWDLRL